MSYGWWLIGSVLSRSSCCEIVLTMAEDSISQLFSLSLALTFFLLHLLQDSLSLKRGGVNVLSSTQHSSAILSILNMNFCIHCHALKRETSLIKAENCLWIET